jgi:hypothetical protein
MTLYVRNWRPNQLMFKHAGVKILLNRRGTRDDNVALPDEAMSNPVVARFLRTGKLERISEEGFHLLATRQDDEVMPGIKTIQPEKVTIDSKPSDPNSPLQSTPTFVEAFNKREVRSPQLEWETDPEPTKPAFVGVDTDKLNKNDPFGLTESEPETKKSTKKKTAA